MKQKLLLVTILITLHISASAQYVIFVIDKQAIAKSSENLAVNVIKQQEYKKILEFSEDILGSYTNIEALQLKVLEDLKQVESIKDLHWTDLSRPLYLAGELVKGTTQPGLEIDYVIEHPLFNESPSEIYQNLFIAGAADPLPADLNSLKEAKQRSRSLSSNFQQFAAERKAYAAVAYQYLAEDLILKSTEMNEVLKQPDRLPVPAGNGGRHGFSMTEAERMRLQSYSEDYLQLAGEMLEKSDKFLLEIAYCRPLQREANQAQKRLERNTISHTTVLDY